MQRVDRRPAVERPARLRGDLPFPFAAADRPVRKGRIMPFSIADRSDTADAIAHFIRAIEKYISAGRPAIEITEDSTLNPMREAKEALLAKLLPTWDRDLDPPRNAYILDSQLDRAEKAELHKLWESLQRGPLWPFTILNTPELAIVELEPIMAKLRTPKPRLRRLASHFPPM